MLFLISYVFELIVITLKCLRKGNLNCPIMHHLLFPGSLDIWNQPSPHNSLVLEDEMKWVSFVFSPHHVQSIQPISSYSPFGLCLSLLAVAFSTVSPWLPEVSVIDYLAWLWQGHCCHAKAIIELLGVGRAGSDSGSRRGFLVRCAQEKQSPAPVNMLLYLETEFCLFYLNECSNTFSHIRNIPCSTDWYKNAVTCYFIVVRAQVCSCSSTR